MIPGSIPALVRRRPANPGHHPHRDVQPDGHRVRVGVDPAAGPLQGRRPHHEHRLVHPRGSRVHPDHVEGQHLFLLPPNFFKRYSSIIKIFRCQTQKKFGVKK